MKINQANNTDSNFKVQSKVEQMQEQLIKWDSVIKSNTEKVGLLDSVEERLKTIKESMEESIAAIQDSV